MVYLAIPSTRRKQKDPWDLLASQSCLVCEFQVNKRVKGGGWYFSGWHPRLSSDIRYTHLHMHIHACIHVHTQGRKAYKQLIRCGTAWFQQVSLVQLAHAAALHAPDAGESFDFESQCGLETQRPRPILEPHPVPQTLPPAASEASRKWWLKSQAMHQSTLISLGQLLGQGGGSWNYWDIISP